MIKPFRFAGWQGENSRLDPVYIQPNELSDTNNVRINEGTVESSEGYETTQAFKMPTPQSLAISPALSFTIFPREGTVDSDSHPYWYTSGVNDIYNLYPKSYMRKITSFSGNKGDMISILLLCKGISVSLAPGFTLTIFADNGGVPDKTTILSDTTSSDASIPYTTTNFREWIAAHGCLNQDVSTQTVWIGFTVTGSASDYLEVCRDKSTAGIGELSLWNDQDGNPNPFPSSHIPLCIILKSQQIDNSNIYKQSFSLETSYKTGLILDIDLYPEYFRKLYDSSLEHTLFAESPQIVSNIAPLNGTLEGDIGYYIKSNEFSTLSVYTNTPQIIKAYSQFNLGYKEIIAGGGYGSIIFLTAPNTRNCIPITYTYMRSQDIRAHVYKTALVINEYALCFQNVSGTSKNPSWINLTDLSKKTRFSAAYTNLPISDINPQIFNFIWTQHGSLYFGSPTWNISNIYFSEPNDFDTGTSSNFETVFNGQPITAVLSVGPNESYISSQTQVLRWVGSFGNIRSYILLKSGCPNRECMQSYLLGDAILTCDGLWLIQQGVPSLLIDNTNIPGDWDGMFDSNFVLYDPEYKELIVRYGTVAYRYNIVDKTFTRIDTPGDNPAVLYGGNRRVLQDNYTRYSPDTWKAVDVTTGFIDLGGDIEQTFHRLELEFKVGTPTPTSYTISTDRADGSNQVTSGGIWDSSGNEIQSFIIPLNLKGNKLKIDLHWDVQTSMVRWIGGKVHFSSNKQNTKRGV